MFVVIDLPKPPLKFQKYNQVIRKAIEEIAEEVMTKATREAVIENYKDSGLPHVSRANGKNAGINL